MMERFGTPSIIVLLAAMGLGCGDGPNDHHTDDGPVTLTATRGSDPSGDDDGRPGTVGSTGTVSTTSPADGTATDPSGSTDEPPAGCGDPPVWCPGPSTGWQWQLSGPIDSSLDVEMYDIDLFDVDASVISSLHADGRVVVCYFSAGSHEDWRPDADQFPPSAIGSPLDGWPGERWLDTRDATVREVLAARLDTAAAKGCDGVEPDNVDGYTNDTGFGLTGADQLDFNRWLAEQAHARGLSVGLKNDVDQVQELVDHFDWSLDEECMAYDECDLLMPFIAAGKAVFHVEYVDDPASGPDLAAQICPDAQARSFSTLVKHWDLDAWGIACQ